ncbi:MAG TPA: UMP kinase [Patescibacteria group bacterium]|nr:UMP kinase [Patescibacteria group bacterium]
MIQDFSGVPGLVAPESGVLVLSIGGSIVAPKEGIDTVFLQKFKNLIEKSAKGGWRFVIVVGGGAPSRRYQEAARQVGVVVNEDLDWLGIHATRLNAHLLRTVFRRTAHPTVVKDPSRPLRDWTRPVLIAAGWKPGWSTDYVAVRLARRLGAKVIVNLTDVDYVYDKNPKEHSDAEPICRMAWKEFRRMMGTKWNPGMNVPFDPVAARLADHSNISVVVANGRNLENLTHLLSGKGFAGTVIGTTEETGFLS